VVYEHSAREPGRERAGTLVRQRLRTWGDTSVGTYVVTLEENETRNEEPR